MREKTEFFNRSEAHELEFIPTIIFYKDGAEIGRIVETPAESLEKVVLKIVIE